MTNISEQEHSYNLERYKFILQQIHTLNVNIFKYLVILQALGTAIVGAQIAILVGARELSLSYEIAHIGIQTLMWLWVILAAYVIISILSGIFSWWDYRNEEVELLERLRSSGIRERPQKRNFWRWYETWLIVLIVIVMGVLVWATYFQLMPALDSVGVPISING